ncbi:MAG: acylphosphatase [Candidatus Omnitrophota bacterium]|nr:acylphosphatase [Candidatus Omnitrophota bacterium]
MNKRIHAYYSGSVQGVGFRYMAERTATSLNLTGWVKNIRDGRVEIVCEGSEASLSEFLQKIDKIFSAYISDKDIEWGNATKEFDYFDIRF